MYFKHKLCKSIKILNEHSEKLIMGIQKRVRNKNNNEIFILLC
jgi:hypothetical protein